MSYKALKLDLTEKQVWTALKGNAIKIKPSQINTGNQFISLHRENAKKVERAFMQKKGCTLHLSQGELLDTAARMDGSGFWSNAWKFIKDKAWPALKKSGILTAAADAAVPILSTYTGQPAAVAGARKLLKDTTGVGIEQKEQATRKRMTKADKYEQMRAAGIYLS